jgi:hypothetical protein
MRAFVEGDRAITLHEAADRSGYTVETCRKFVRAGGQWSDFSGKVGKGWRVSEVGLTAWINVRFATNKEGEAAA